MDSNRRIHQMRRADFSSVPLFPVPSGAPSSGSGRGHPSPPGSRTASPLSASGRMQRHRNDRLDPPAPDRAGEAAREFLCEYPPPAPPVSVLKAVQCARHRLPVQPQAPSLIQSGPLRVPTVHMLPRQPLPAVRTVFLCLIFQRFAAVHAAGLPDERRLLPAGGADALPGDFPAQRAYRRIQKRQEPFPNSLIRSARLV